MLSFRFIYGLRIAGAIACGLSALPTPRFIVLNLIAATVWTTVILGLGYTFGTALETAIGEIGRLEWKLLGAIAAIAGVFLVTRRLLKRRRT